MRSNILIVFFFLIPVFGFSQLVINAGFEDTGKDGFAKYWQKFPGQCADISVDKTMAHEGRRSVKISVQLVNNADNSAYILYTINTSSIPSIKKIVLSAWVQSTASQDSSVCIILNDDDKQLFSQAFASHKKLDFSAKWQKLIITKELREAKKKYQIYIACYVKGKTTAWFDDFSITVNGKNIDKKQEIHFAKNDKRWLSDHAITTDFGSDKSKDTFFLKLNKVIANKYFLGVGEPTHGTREAFEFKIELFKNLVLNHDYRIIVLENGMAESYMINQYINGEYCLEGALSKQEYKKYLNDFLYTKEMIDFIEWMRSFNQSHTDKISFVGMDVQNHEQCIANLKGLLLKLGILGLKDKLDKIDSAILNLKSALFNDSHLRQAIIEQVDMLCDIANRALQNSRHDNNDVKWFYRHIDLLKMFLLEDDARWNNYSMRSQYMFNNILWFLKNQRIDKMMIWAHNGHINKMQGAQNIFQREGSLGSFLKLNFGDSYYCLGIYAANGTYSARGSEIENKWNSFELENPAKNSVEYYLSSCRSSSNFFLDLSKSLEKEAPEFLTKNILQRANGMIYNHDQFYSIGSSRNLYDGIFFIENSINTSLICQ